MADTVGLLGRIRKVLRPEHLGTLGSIDAKTAAKVAYFDEILGEIREADLIKQARSLLTQERAWTAPKYGLPRWSTGQLLSIRMVARNGFGSICNDAVVDRVASMPWDIVPKVGAEYNKKHVEEIKKFFENPNQNDESFVSILRGLTRGILETDDGAVEKVFDKYEETTTQLGSDRLTVKVPAKGAKLTEMFVMDGSTLCKIVDEHGYLMGYWQVPNLAKSVYFDKRQIVYMMLNPIPGSVYGRSPFMAIVEELEILKKALRFNAAFFKNFAFPGLHLDYKEPKSEADLNRAYEELIANYAGEDRAWRPFVTAGGAEIKTIAPTPENLQAIQLQQLYQKIVMAKLKVTPAMLGFTEDVNRATAISQKREFRDRTLLPLLRTIEYHLNTQVVSEFGYDDVEFQFIAETDIDDELQRARIDEIYLKTGSLTVNEIRERMGLEPVAWGEVPFIIPQPYPGMPVPAKVAKAATSAMSNALSKELKEILNELRARYGKEPLDELRKELLELAKTTIRECLAESKQEVWGTELTEAQAQRVQRETEAAYRDFVRIFEDEVLRLMQGGRGRKG